MNDQTPSPGNADDGAAGSTSDTPPDGTADHGPAAAAQDAATAATGESSRGRRPRWARWRGGPGSRRPKRRSVVVAAAVVGLLAVGGAGSAAIGHALSDAGGHRDGRGTVGDVRGGHRYDGDRDGAGPVAPVAPPVAGTGTTTS